MPAVLSRRSAVPRLVRVHATLRASRSRTAAGNTTGGARKTSKTDPTNSEAGQTAGYKTLDRRRSQHQSLLTSLSYTTRAANMKVAVVFLAMLVCTLAEKYTTKYDNIDLDSILNSDRLLNNYVNCLLDAGSCTPDGKELKKSLPEALENNCEKCSEKQKEGSDKVIRFLINKKPSIWERLSKKYDPTGEYKLKFQDQAQQRGIELH